MSCFIYEEEDLRGLGVIYYALDFSFLHDMFFLKLGQLKTFSLYSS